MTDQATPRKVYKVRFMRSIDGDDPCEDDHILAAHHAEDAIARVREHEIGQRVHWADDNGINQLSAVTSVEIIDVTQLLEITLDAGGGR